MKKHEMDKPEIIQLYLTLGELEYILSCLHCVADQGGFFGEDTAPLHEMVTGTITKKIETMTYNGRRE
jgi:hypothetical protein